MSDTTKLISEARRQAQSPWDEPWKDTLRDFADTLEAADKAITWGDEKITRITEQLAAAQAVIAGAVAYNEDQPFPNSRLRATLAQSPTDALEAVKEAAWDEGERHESEYLTLTGQFCPHAGCNPYRATTIEGEKP